MALSFLPKNAFPLPAPLTPTLIALGLDSEAAGAISKVYLSAALTLKEKWEAEYTEACHALIAASDDRGYSSKGLRARLLTVSVTRYGQALSEWMNEIIQKAETSVMKQRGSFVQCKVKNTVDPPPRPSHCKRSNSKRPEKSNRIVKSAPFSATSPSYAFPCTYPPPARPDPVSLVTHVPRLERSSGYKSRTVSERDLGEFVGMFSRLSLGPPSPQGKKPSESPKAAQKPRPRPRTTSIPKPTSQLSPSRPRLVSPKLDTSVAVSHKSLPKTAQPHPSPTTVPRTRNIDIPRSNRRKVSSIPYQRPTTRPSVSPESPESHSPRTIRRTPSLVSDHGSEASSPSTPPDFSSISIPSPILPCKDSLPPAFPLEEFLVPWSGPGWEDIDFGTNFYG